MSFLFGFPFDFDGGGPRRKDDGDDDVHIDGVSADGGDDTPRRQATPDNPNAFRMPRITRAGSGAGKGHGGSKAGRVLGVVVAVIAVLAVLVFASTRFITDIMWYAQLGFTSVVFTQWGMQVGMWIVCAILFALVALLAASLAIQARPADADGTQLRMRGGTLELSKGVTSKVARRAALIVSLVVGIFFGASLSANWTELLLMFHAQPFGKADPQFGIDAGFYVFVLPGLNAILSTVLTMLVVALVMSAIAHLLMGGIRFTLPTGGRGVLDMTRRARRQLGVWIVLVALVGAVRIALGAFNLLTEQGDRVTGATYTSVNATIPAIFISAALFAAVGVFLGVWLIVSRRLTDSFGGSSPVSFATAMRAWRMPAVSVAVAVVIALVASVVYPAVIQRFKVNPNAQELESEYISRNIEATTYAYGLDNLKVEAYNATTKGESGALANEADTTAQIRLLDPQVVSPTFKQLQQSKQYYTFADTLAVDKYEVDGVSQDTVIAARELDLAGNDNRNWVNDHTVYTHGYGVVAAYGNKVTADGQPQFFESGIPTQGKLTDSQHYEPRIYFSPNAPEYSIVGAPEGTASWEFDYPTGSEGATNTFAGSGGPSVGNFFSRLLYAIRFGSDQILFSDRVTSASQILYDRSPKDRVAKVAPYLTLDGRVYPAVVDGRVKWIVDGYTTSDAYPYSQMADLGTASKDSTTVSSQTVSGLASKQANYIRNSVKATVDAYDGSVQLYAWDADDPVLKAWEAIFPGQYHPLSEISGDLMSHLRYPESLFKVQRELLAKYHVGSASQFFSGEDFWQTPVDPTEPQSQQEDDILQPPYYLTLQTGGTKEPVFSLTSTYIPAGTSTREILTGFLSVDSDAGDTAGTIGPNYGTLRLQELPKDSNVPGPGQAQNNFNANADVSKELNLLESGSTNVVRGNLLTLPLGGGLVYVQPVYVKSSGATSFPLLKKVLVAFGDQVGFANTLDEALDQVFGGDSGASAGDAQNSGSSTQQGGASQSGDSQQSGQSGQQQSGQSSGSGTQSQGSGSSAQDSQLQAALDDAAQAMKDSQSAMKNGDWSAYGEAQRRLEDAINKALELEK